MQNPQSNPPGISVLLPVYNGELELGETVQHILNQTYQDFELLMLDDASTDATWSLMEKLAAQDSRIKIWQVTENIGIVRALNQLASKARGDILVREDCGDISHPERYALQHAALSANTDATICVTDYWRLDADGVPIGVVNIPATSEDILKQLEITNNLAHASFAIRKSALEQVNGYDPDLYCSQDYDLVLKLLKIGPIIPINKPLLGLRYNPTGISFRNAAKQAAYAKLIKSRHFGTEPPERLDLPPLPLAETEANYHEVVGKLHLVKGRPRLARNHFRAAYTRRPGLKLVAGIALTLIPSSCILAFRRLAGKDQNSQPEYFAKKDA